MMQPGARLSLPGISWSDVQQTVVLFARHDCAPTGESAPFYRKLIRRLETQRDFAFAVISTDPVTEMRTWMNGESIRADLVVQIPDPPATGLFLTPTILIMGRDGIVDTVLAGRLLPHEEQAVLDRVTDGRKHATSNVPDEIGEAEFTSLERSGEKLLIDGREEDAYRRSHRPGAVNIPFPQLAARAPSELDPARRVILDCPRQIATACPGAGTFLRQSGFARVSLLFSGFPPN